MILIHNQESNSKRCPCSMSLSSHDWLTLKTPHQSRSGVKALWIPPMVLRMDSLFNIYYAQKAKGLAALALWLPAEPVMKNPSISRTSVLAGQGPFRLRFLPRPLFNKLCLANGYLCGHPCAATCQGSVPMLSNISTRVKEIRFQMGQQDQMISCVSYLQKSS
jgi:hypothetical protein